jgi:hypothetical protein
MPNSTKNLNSMATTYKNKPTVPAKPSHSLNKQTRKSPYNTRSPEKPLLSPHEMPTLTSALEMLTHTDNIIHTTPIHQVLKKRTCLFDLVLPPKKGPGVSIVRVPPDITPLTSNILVFTPGYSKKSPTRAIFKAARKGKNKLVPIVLDSEIVSVLKGGFAKHPQQQ